VVAAAQQLTIALQGNIPTGNKNAEALQKVSKLFTRIAMVKSATGPWLFFLAALFTWELGTRTE
jgi:hypothetical protein